MDPADSTHTSIAPFRNLVRVLRECASTGTPLSWAAKELKETDLALGELRAHFDRELEFVELTPEVEAAVIVLHRSFETLAEALTRLGATFADDDAATAEAELRRASAALADLEGALDVFRAVERRRPVLSPAPYVNELLRVGRAYLAGDLGPGALEGRLDPLREFHGQVLQGALGDPAAAGLLPLLEEHGQALEAARVALDAEDAEALAAALEAIGETARRLHEKGQEEAAPAEIAQEVLCIRCGTAARAGQRSCPSCGARLPAVSSGCEEAPGGTAGLQDLPAFLERLFATAERLRGGEEAWGDLGEAVAELRRRSEQGLGILERIAPPPPGTPEDEVSAWHEAQANLENGLERFFMGLEALEALPGQPEDWLLDQGLAALREAVSETREAAAVWERFVQERASREE